MTDDANGTDEASPVDPPADGRGRAAEVGATYDRIAEHFSETREYPWPEVTEFLAGRDGRIGLDAGCGNGRHAEPLGERVDRGVGVDASGDLLAVARRRARDRGYADGLAFVRGDAAALPVAAGSVDLAVYVAVLHHLAPRERRVASLAELSRALAPGGRALVSAWSTEHDRFADDAGDGGTGTGFDTEVDWTLPGGETVGRFYHVYAPAEFRTDLDAGGLRTVESFVSSGNCYAVVAPGDG